MASREICKRTRPKLSYESDPENFMITEVAPLTPEQIDKLWRTGRDNEELDTYDAELARERALDEAREQTLRVIEGGK